MKKLIALMLTLALSLSMVACGSKEEEAAAPAENAAESTEAGEAASEGEDLTWGLTPFEERQTLRLGFFTGSPLSYPFLFADKLGVFDALNIDIEYTCFTGGPAMMEANAEWDMASCGLGGLANG